MLYKSVGRVFGIRRRNAVKVDRLIRGNLHPFSREVAKETPMLFWRCPTIRALNMLSPPLPLIIPNPRVNFAVKALNLRIQRINSPNAISLLPQVGDFTIISGIIAAASAGRNRPFSRLVEHTLKNGGSLGSSSRRRRRRIIRFRQVSKLGDIGATEVSIARGSGRRRRRIVIRERNDDREMVRGEGCRNLPRGNDSKVRRRKGEIW